MRVLTLFFAIALFALTSPIMAQEAGDEAAIRATINNYFEGIKERDKSKLAKAFLDSDAHMKFVRTRGGKQSVSVADYNQTLKRLSSGRKNPDLKGKILSIDIYNPIAAFAVFDFDNRYIDGFQLVKVNGNWRIINKTFVDK